MPRTPATFSELDREALLDEVAAGVVSARAAVTLMVMHGRPEREAARDVFHALGGSDVTMLDTTGRVRYAGSGKRISDLERAITADTDR